MASKKEVEDNTIFLTLAGSRAYGTNTDTSDFDYRGACILRDKTYYLGTGLNHFEQMDKGFEDDRVIFDLRKFLALAADNNPNVLELLFAEPELWLKTSVYWDKIFQYRNKFLSKLARFRYCGYAISQLHRIRNHRGYLLNPPNKKPARADFGLPAEKTIKNDDLGAFQWLLSKFLRNNVQDLNVSESAKEELHNLDFIGLVQSNMSKELSNNEWTTIQNITGASDEFIALMYKEKAYINAMNNWTSYQGWKSKRNEKRRALEEKYGYDTKNALHLVRLMRSGMEILETGKLLVRRPDAEELKAIRNGAWSFEQVEEYAAKCEEKFNQLYQTSTLPKQPDRVFIDKLCQEIIEEYVWSKT